MTEAKYTVLKHGDGRRVSKRPARPTHSHPTSKPTDSHTLPRQTARGVAEWRYEEADRIALLRMVAFLCKICARLGGHLR